MAVSANDGLVGVAKEEGEDGHEDGKLGDDDAGIAEGTTIEGIDDEP